VRISRKVYHAIHQTRGSEVILLVRQRGRKCAEVGGRWWCATVERVSRLRRGSRDPMPGAESGGAGVSATSQESRD